MNVTITGRHLEITPSLREYAEKKIQKLERYFHQFIDAHVIMYVNKIDHVSEITINGDGIRFHGTEKAADMYSSIDLLMEKMEKQVVKHKEKHSGHKATSLSKSIEIKTADSESIEVMYSHASNKPIDEVEAFLEMKLDKRDFILFKKGVKEMDTDKDHSDKNYAMIYKCNDGHKMVEMPFEMIRKNAFDVKNFIEYDLIIINDSQTSPKIKLKKKSDAGIKKMTLDDALKEIESIDVKFIPFFNADTNFFNIIYKNGKKYELMIPSIQ
jgi:putative sigma-54 modulation protein